MFFPCLLHSPGLVLHIRILHYQLDFICVQCITSENCIFSLDTCYTRWNSDKNLFLDPATLLNERHIQPSCLYGLRRKKGMWTTEGSFYSSSHILVVNASCPLEMLKSYHKQFSAMVPAFVAWDPKAPSLTTFYSVPAHCLIFLSYHSPHFPSIYYILTSLLECFGLELSASPIKLELFLLYTTSDIR